jgi:hypothetical protein
MLDGPTRLSCFAVEPIVTYNFTSTLDNIPMRQPWWTYLVPATEQANLTRFLRYDLMDDVTTSPRYGYMIDVHFRSNLSVPGSFSNAQAANHVTKLAFPSLVQQHHREYHVRHTRASDEVR